MDEELSIGKFSAPLLETSGGIELSALLKSTPDPDSPDDLKLKPTKAQSFTRVSEGARQHEVYCLAVRVIHNVGLMATTEGLVPPNS